MGKTIRLQPMSGKFLQTSVNGKTINIFLVDPKDNKQGSEVDYEDAMRILAFKHPVATPVPVKDKKGKFVSVLTDEDKKKIAEYKANPVNQTVANNVNNSSSDTAVLTKIVENQSDILKAQTEMLAQMKQEIADLKKK